MDNRIALIIPNAIIKTMLSNKPTILKATIETSKSPLIPNPSTIMREIGKAARQKALAIKNPHPEKKRVLPFGEESGTCKRLLSVD